MCMLSPLCSGLVGASFLASFRKPHTPATFASIAAARATSGKRPVSRPRTVRKAASGRKILGHAGDNLWSRPGDGAWKSRHLCACGNTSRAPKPIIPGEGAGKDFGISVENRISFVFHEQGQGFLRRGLAKLVRRIAVASFHGNISCVRPH